jgi:hypothetical protein
MKFLHLIKFSRQNSLLNEEKRLLKKANNQNQSKIFLKNIKKDLDEKKKINYFIKKIYDQFFNKIKPKIIYKKFDKAGEKSHNFQLKKNSFIILKHYNNFKKEKKFKNIPNINLLFPQKSNFQRSNSNYYDDLFGSSSGLFKKDLPNYKYDSERNFYEHINNTQNAKDEKFRSVSGTKQSINESKNAKKKRENINMKGDKKGENETRKGPEEIHWFLVKSIQEGKKLQNNVDF